jgi:DNA-binding NtrC family response regulator
VLVDATSAREHDAARWTNAELSPLALADRGMLVLLDGAALPAEVQELVARACAEKRAPWERPDPLDVQLALTGTCPPEELAAESRLTAALALRLADAAASPVWLPRLRDRPDDLRSILTDRLAREGLRVLGRPVGIDQAAYARLVDYPFPGEDAELAGVVRRLVAACAEAGRDVVRAPDVVSLELNFAADAHTAGAGGVGAENGNASGAQLRKDPISA